MTTLDIDRQPFSLSLAPGFTSFYGVPVVAVGEDCGTLIMLGQPDERTILAAVTAHFRVIYGQRILPGPEVNTLLREVRRTWARAVPGGGYCLWHTEETDPHALHAQSITLVEADWLEVEDLAVQEECPACGRASRSSELHLSPGRHGWSQVHRCGHCATQWPCADVYRPCLYKPRHTRGRVLSDPADCFGCGCSTLWPCQDGCTTATTRPITQPLCRTCLAQHTPDTWHALTQAGYATPASDPQRDRWLYGEALRGTPPAEAAAAWTERCALVRRRVLAPYQKAKHTATETRP
ncbi:hypothetical protein [Streptomyces hygroscopicus]|uniref:hypothetical protein n=1 Tax=Streptomyces hygroscopicus TaxID=1912 RepID=UPI00078541BE|nr:hypothetical protein [Streptomyces hygroscopicus]